MSHFSPEPSDRPNVLMATSDFCHRIIAQMQLGVLVWQMQRLDDPTSFSLVEANPAAEQMSRQPMRAMMGRSIRDCFPKVRQDVLTRFAEVVHSGKAAINQEITYGDGCSDDAYSSDVSDVFDVFDVSDVSDVSTENNPSEPVPHQIFSFSVLPLPERCIAVIFEDITERRQNQLDLQARAQELVNLNSMLSHTTALLKYRNDELDQFAYVASHDLKAPLRAIANLSAWLEEDLADQLPAENSHQLQLLRGRVQRMEGFIDGLLTYSRIGRQQIPVEPVDVVALIHEILDSLAPPPEFRITITSEVAVFTTKRLLLQQVLANLIGNSIKHHHRQDGSVQISVTDHDTWVEFAIADDGPGIAPQYHDKVFTIFQTLQSRDTKESTGIGLSIVRKILQFEDNTITLESEQDQGATFRFTWQK